MKTANMTLEQYLASLPRETGKGRWAVACVSYRQWMCTMAIGDGITKATASLLTRCGTRKEAEAIVARIAELTPGVLPGSPGVYEYVAIPYDRDDYLCENVRKFGRRNCDRQIVGQ